MKLLLIAVQVALLAGCGGGAAATAATSAAIKKQGETGKQDKEMLETKIDQATKPSRQRAEQQGNVDR